MQRTWKPPGVRAGFVAEQWDAEILDAQPIPRNFCAGNVTASSPKTSANVS